MTIAAGFVCHEGVLLASDTLYTGHNKRHSRKLWALSGGPVVIGFGAAGYEMPMRRIPFEIESRLGHGLDPADVVTACDEAIAAVWQLMGEQAKATQAIFAINDGTGTVRLYESFDVPALAPTGQHAQVVGTGAPLGQYLIDALYREPMAMKWARLVACHMIRVAKLYAGDCDGATNLLEVYHDGRTRFVIDQAEIASYEKPLAAIDAAFRAVLPDGRADDETLETRLGILMAIIETVGRAMYIKEPFLDAAVGLSASCEIIRGPGHVEPTGSVGPE